MRCCGRRPSLRREDGGQILALFAGSLAALLIIAAFTVDAGYAWWAKRALQAGADAAALAGAQDLSNPATAKATALLYSGDAATPGARNKSVPGTVAEVCVPGDACGAANKIIVTQRATVETFFWRVLGKENYDVSARAVASFSVVPTAGSPMAIFAEENCGNKGIIGGSANIWIEGSIHANGHYQIGGSNFRSGKATRWRPPSGNPGCTNSYSGAKFDCAPSAITDCATWINPPTAETGARRSWPTGTSITESTLRGPGNANCYTGTTPSSITPSNIGMGRTYCYDTTDVNLSGNFAAGTTVTIVTRGSITFNGTGSLKAARDNVLFFRDTSDKEITVNPGGTFVFEGYIINRTSGVKINQSNVTTPSNGYLEAKWVDLNGEGFKMFGLLPDSSTSTGTVEVHLEE